MFYSNVEAAKREKRGENEMMQMSTESDSYIPTGKFVIEGHVDPAIPDSCYNIYITDIDKKITSQDLVACVPVINKRFRFETDLSTMKRGRIRAIMPGNQLCSAWIEVYFIPDFTTDMTVHNGYYDMHNQNEYQFMTTAWLNHDAMKFLCDGTISPVSDQSTITDEFELNTALRSYQLLLEDIKKQINDLYRNGIHLNGDLRANTFRKLYNQMDQINNKMEALIDKYAAKLQY